MSTGRNVLNGHNKCTGGEIHALDGLPVEGNDHIHQLVVVRNLYGILHSVAHLRGAGISGDGHDRCVGILNDYGLGGFGNITGSIRNNKLDFVHIEIGGVKVISAVAVNGHFLTIDGQNRTLHCNVILYGDRQGAIASIADGRAAIDGSGGADVILTDNLEYGNGLGLISSRIPDYCLEGDVLHTLIIQTVAIGGVDIGHSLGQGHFHPILIEDNLSHCHVVLGFQCDGDGITHNHFCIAQLNGSRGTLGVRYAGDDFLCGADVASLVLNRQNHLVLTQLGRRKYHIFVVCILSVCQFNGFAVDRHRIRLHAAFRITDESGQFDAVAQDHAGITANRAIWVLGVVLNLQCEALFLYISYLVRSHTLKCIVAGCRRSEEILVIFVQLDLQTIKRCDCTFYCHIIRVINCDRKGVINIAGIRTYRYSNGRFRSIRNHPSGACYGITIFVKSFNGQIVNALIVPIGVRSKSNRSGSVYPYATFDASLVIGNTRPRELGSFTEGDVELNFGAMRYINRSRTDLQFQSGSCAFTLIQISLVSNRDVHHCLGGHTISSHHIGSQGILPCLGEGNVFQQLSVTADLSILSIGYGPVDLRNGCVIADQIQHSGHRLTNHGTFAAADACPGANKGVIRLLTVQCVYRQVIQHRSRTILRLFQFHQNLQISACHAGQHLVVADLNRLAEVHTVLTGAQVHIQSRGTHVISVPAHQRPCAAVPTAVVNGAFPASVIGAIITADDHIFQIHHCGLAVTVIVGQGGILGDHLVACTCQKLCLQRQTDGLDFINTNGIVFPHKCHGAIGIFRHRIGSDRHIGSIQIGLVGDGSRKDHLITGVVVYLVGKLGHGTGNFIGIGTQQIISFCLYCHFLHTISVAVRENGLTIHLEDNDPNISITGCRNCRLQGTSRGFAICQQ